MDTKEALVKTRKLPAQTKVEIMRGVNLRRTASGIPVASIHYSANPDRDPKINPDWQKSERKTYTSKAAWDREQEMVDEAGGGELVFADTLITYWDKIVISDPGYRPHSSWRVEAGFDHGKTNPTAFEREYTDPDGCIIFCGEYYMPGLEVWQHAPRMKQMADIRKVSAAYADPSIFPETMQQGQTPNKTQERAKSINELYCEQGIELFSPFAGDRSDVSFAARVMLHWADLENREPTLKIVCRNYSEKPQPGLHDWDCPNLLWEMMRTRRVKLTAVQLLGQNVAEAIVDKDNHARDACFVAGTRITTRRGDVPIEFVTTNDEVLTRDGWKRIKDARVTSIDAEIWRVRLSNGVELLTTASHPIWIDKRGFLLVDEIKYGMLCLCLKENTESRKSSTGWASTFTDTPTAKSAILETTLETAASIYTHWCGYLKTAGRFLRSITSTIGTVIASTMSHPILKRCLELSTYGCPPTEASQKKILRGWQRCAMLPNPGIRALKEEHGTLSMEENSCALPGKRIVRTAEHLFRTGTREKETHSAQGLAVQNGVIPTGSITSKGHAPTAAINSPARDTRSLDFAHGYAQVLSVEKTQLRLPVYNVSVESQPEYFANGVLVHNCKYLVMSHPQPTIKTMQQIAKEAVAEMAAQGDLTSSLIRYNQKLDQVKAQTQPARMGRRR